MLWPPFANYFRASPCYALHAQTFFLFWERSKRSSHSRHNSRLRPYHHPQNTLTQTQSWQPYIHVSPTPHAALSCLSHAASKEPPQTLSQRTSLRLVACCRAEDRQWPCQAQEADEGGEIWQLSLLFSPSDHPLCSVADLRGTSHCRGKTSHSEYLSWEGSSFVPGIKEYCGKLVSSMKPIHQQPWAQIPSVCCGQQALVT